MHLDDEIQSIRRELKGVERNVAHLALRLDEAEARQRGREAESAQPKTPEALSPAATPVTPPPLPPKPAAPKSAVPPATSQPVVPTFTATPKKASAPPATAAKAAPKPKKPRRFGPPEDMTFEMALGSYWAPRIGMLLVAIGVVWGFTYAAQQFKDAAWMPYARVGLGYALSGSLLAIGYWLEKKYTNYARILMGGGLGLIYFVTFATWYIPATRIAPSQEFTLGALGLLVLGWGALAQWRKSHPIALTMTLLGHFTVALSTLSLELPSRTAVGGLLVLGIGSAWFLVRNGWYLVAMSAMLGSYLNQLFWLSRSPGSDLPADFVVGMAVLIVYLLTFAVAEFITPPNRRTVPPRIRNLFVGLNTTGFVLLSLGLVRSFSFAEPREHLLYFCTALFTFVMGFAYLQRDGKDRVAAMYFTKTSVLVTVGLATWLDGTTLTLSLALESLVLLITARYRREHTGRLLALGTSVITFAHAFYAFQVADFPAWGDAGFAGEVAVAAAVVVIFGLLTEYYRVTPWHSFSAMSFPNGRLLTALCQLVEMHQPGREGGPRRSRQIVAHALAFLGVMLFTGYCGVLFSPDGTLLCLGVAALVVVSLGLRLASAPFLSAGILLALFDGGVFLANLRGDNALSNTNLLLGGAAPMLLLSEALGKFLPRRLKAYARQDGIQGAWARNHQLVAMAYSGLAAAMMILIAVERFPVEQAMFVGGLLGLGATVYAAALASPCIGLFGMAMAVYGGIQGVEASTTFEQPWFAVTGLLCVAFAASATESRWWGNRPGLNIHRLLPTPYLLYGSVAWGGLWLTAAFYSYPVRPVAFMALAVAFGLAVPWLHRRATTVFGTLLSIAAFVAWVSNVTPAPPGPWFHGTFALILAGALGGDRLFAQFKPFARPIPGAVLLAVAWLASFHFNKELSASAWYFTGLAALSLAFLGYGALFRTRTAVVLSLISAAFATVPLLAMPLNSTVTTAAICGAFGAVIIYWLGAERGTTIVLERTGFQLVPGHRPILNAVLTGLPTLLGIVWFTRIEAIHDFYLTISWTVWALALFVWALTTKQPWFRYAALCTIGLAIGRAFLVDVWQLEGLYRVGAMIFLGLALLGVAFGYTRWRATQEAGGDDS
jgi:uncharacterized membrane protein